jgi:hypothetical protein
MSREHAGVDRIAGCFKLSTCGWALLQNVLARQSIWGHESMFAT